MNPAMLAQHLARSIGDLAAAELALVSIGFHQRLVITETNILAFRTFRHRQAKLSRTCADLGLLHSAERKERMRKLILPKRKQKIGLVLTSICAAKE